MKDIVYRKEISLLINEINQITDNQWEKLFKLFCLNKSIAYNWDIKKNHFNEFKNYIRESLGLILDKDFDKRYSLDNIPSNLLSADHPIAWWLYNIKKLSKTIWSNEILKDINININYDDRVVLIWKNWAGKSTLLRILAGFDDYDSWEISMQKWLKIWYLSQNGFGDNENITLKEDMESVFETISSDIKRLNQIQILMESWVDDIYPLIEEQFKILERLEINDWYKKYDMQFEILKYFWFTDNYLNMNISQLSWWERTKIQIAKFILQKVDILLLDEPTNHLDIWWILFLESFLKKRKKWMICITHDKVFINSIVSKIWELNDGKIVEYNWNYDDYVFEKKKKLEIQQERYQEQEDFIKKQKKFIDTNRARKSKVGAVKSRMKQLESLDKINKPLDEKKIKDIKINIKNKVSQSIISLQDIEIWYEHKKLFKLDGTLAVQRNDKIWLIWKNWAGKTTLLKTIVWDTLPLKWKIFINENVKIWYYSQIADNLTSSNTILSELSWIWWVTDFELRRLLASLLISWETVYQKISTLSWWEKSKVALVKMILESPQVLIMDEPTNHLDIQAKEAINNMLVNFPWVVIVASHDRDLLNNIVNKIRQIKEWNIVSFENIELAIKTL